jgi:hypothetical protein
MGDGEETSWTVHDKWIVPWRTGLPWNLHIILIFSEPNSDLEIGHVFLGAKISLLEEKG